MAYDTLDDKLNSVSWHLKRIADALEDLVEINQPQKRLTRHNPKIKDKDRPKTWAQRQQQDK